MATVPRTSRVAKRSISTPASGSAEAGVSALTVATRTRSPQRVPRGTTSDSAFPLPFSRGRWTSSAATRPTEAVPREGIRNVRAGLDNGAPAPLPRSASGAFLQPSTSQLSSYVAHTGPPTPRTTPGNPAVRCLVVHQSACCTGVAHGSNGDVPGFERSPTKQPYRRRPSRRGISWRPFSSFLGRLHGAGCFWSGVSA